MRCPFRCALPALVAGLSALAAVPAVAETVADSLPRVSGPLSLYDALALTDRRQPALHAGDLRAQAAEARIRDGGRRPNPTARAGAENFGGSLGGDRRETTLELAQVIELGGERAARVAVATSEYRLAGADAALSRRDALARTADRFITAWALQARLERLRDGARLLEDAIAAAAERHRAGATLELERTRAEAQALSEGVEQQRTAAELAIARRALAASWGDREATFDSLRGDSSGEPATAASPASHPALDRAAALAALAESRVRAVQASRVPDVTVSAGARRLEEARGTGLVAGVELALPLWNRSDGALAAERRELEAARAERRAAEHGLEVEWTNAIERLHAASATYDTLRLRVRPARVAVTGETLRAYRAGRLGYLDLIAEQRNLLDTDLALVDAGAELWRARTSLELLAGPLPRREDAR